jgi:outer membrane protein W
MKKVLAVVLAVVMMCGVVLAQDAPAGNVAGAKSMNFSFGGLGTFGLGATGINGGLGVTYFLSSDAAVRLGLQVGIASSTTPANPATGQTGKDGESSSTALGVGGDYLMYMGGGRVKPYVGAGVSFSMNSNSSKNVVNTTAGVQVETKNAIGSGAGTTLGLAGIAGAEFYLYNEISLSAEYQLNLFSMTSAADQEQTSGSTTVTTKGSSTTNLLGFSAAGATLHIYF